ncbi:MAG: hypothetical protein AAF183_01505, partial [Pseudomonadota bacterium]
MLSDAEILALEAGVQNVLRISGPVEAGSSDEALIDGVVADILAEEPETLDQAITLLVTSDAA